ncbi:MAG: hypothetical protein ACRD4O_15130, partial [Bryobacteraceae bacterium]
MRAPFRFFLRFTLAGNTLMPLSTQGDRPMLDLDRRTFVKSIAASLAVPAVASAASQAPDSASPNSRTRPP